MNYTSIEQSKKLVELGLKPETADLLYECFKDEVYGDVTYSIDFVCNWQSAYPDQSIFKDVDTFIPCWSLGALLELLRSYNDCIKLDIYSNKGQKWQITISYYDVVWKEHEEINIDLFEASYNTIVWLLENGYIKTEKI